MWREEFKPLPIEVWLEELEKLVVRCAQESLEDEDRTVRRAYNLARLSPLPVRRVMAPSASESELEFALEGERIEEAAKLVIGLGAKIDILESPDAPRTRAILTPKGDEPIEFEASSPALAIIGAWASFLTTAQQN